MRVIATFLLFLCAIPASAQIAAPGDTGVAMGHIELIVADPERNRQLWTDVFGAQPLEREGVTGVKLPGMLVLFREGRATGPSQGSSVHHFGLQVRDRAEIVNAWRAAGLEVLREYIGSEGNPNAHLLTPDGVDVEVTEVSSQAEKAIAHHIHFAAVDDLAHRQWYVKLFAAKPRQRGDWATADIAGINLSFRVAPEGTPSPPLPTKGRAVDHIGFEIEGLEAFCDRLEASGVKFDKAYGWDEDLGIATAVLTDPAGVTLELTEGIDSF